MITPTHTNGHLLIFRGTAWHKGLSPEEIQSVMTRWNDWFEGLRQQGKIVAGNPLENEGRVVTAKSGSISDGPFAESKEAIGGYFLLTVETTEEAVEIAKLCPALQHGIIVEVRPIAPACPIERMMVESQATANA